MRSLGSTGCSDPTNYALNAPDLKGFARAKILRSYLLKCGDMPCAYAVGAQYGGVFQFMDTRFVEAYDAVKQSPGMVLIDLILEDLFRHEKPRFFNFGKGDAFYKQRYANWTLSDSSILLFRRTLGNRVKIASQVAALSAIKLAKRFAGGIRQCKERRRGLE